MNIFQLIRQAGPCLQSMIRNATHAILCLAWAVTGAPTAMAGGIAADDHHHEEAHWTAPADAVDRENPVPISEESVQRGKTIYQANCAGCHGAEGRGDGPAGAALKPAPSNLKVMAPQHPAGDLAWKIAEGRGAMPAWKAVLSENDIWSVVNYLKQFGGAGGHHGGKHGDKDGHGHEDKRAHGRN